MRRAPKVLETVLAVLMTVTTALRGVEAGGPSTVSGSEPCVLLKYAAPGIPDAAVSPWNAVLRDGMPRALSIRWIDAGNEVREERYGPALREAADADLAGLSAALAEAGRAMEVYDTEKAKSLLEKAERDARTIRFDGRTGPFLADLFLKKGVLLHWDGDTAGADLQFGRVRVLLPEFRPDPALFSPRVREAWDGAARKKPPNAEVLVRSLPPGAEVSCGGVVRGKTPLRIGIAETAPVEIRVGLAGYRTAVWHAQWLPGDAGTIDLELHQDPLFRLGEALGRGDIPAASVFLAEMAKNSEASRFAILVVSGDAGRTTVKVLSWEKGSARAVPVWESGKDPGDGDLGPATDRIADRLVASGWPRRPEATLSARPWYHRILPWVLVGAAVIGVAAGLGGGGGSSGGSTGTIGVNF